MTCTEQRRRRVAASDRGPDPRRGLSAVICWATTSHASAKITDQVPAVGDQLGGLLLLRDSSFWERQSQFKKEILGLVVRMVAEAGIHFLRCLGFHESQLRCHHEKRVRI